MTRRKITAAVVAAVCLGATGALAGPAHAEDPAWYAEKQQLNFPKPKRANKPSCSCLEVREKYIWLARGSYSMGAFFADQRDRRNVDWTDGQGGRANATGVIGGGYYIWQIRLFFSEAKKTYAVRSSLRRGVTDRPGILAENYLGSKYSFRGTGNYEWGSRLERSQFGLTAPSR